MPVIIYRLAIAGLALLFATILLTLVDLAAKSWLKRMVKKEADEVWRRQLDVVNAQRRRRLAGLADEARRSLANTDDPREAACLLRFIALIEAQ